jgi:ribosomal protein S18 acetylase RimI-like enzyme
MEPRPYQDFNDFEQMQALLRVGLVAADGSHYVHPGDLSWWLFYTWPETDLWPYIYLWEDPAGCLLGWTLFSPQEQTFDLFVLPEIRCSSEFAGMCAWSAAGASDLMRRLGKRKVYKMWNAEDDTMTLSALDGLGFAPDDQDPPLLYMLRSLSEPLPAPGLPAGFQARGVAGEAEAEARAAAQYAAFDSTKTFEHYIQRYVRFMRSPVYSADLDVMVVAPDGRAAAFCIVWADPQTRLGLFEPVGVHPDFQQQGLGKAVMLEGLRRLRAAGMKIACVCAEADNTAAARLYQSAGFNLARRLVTYSRPV